MGEPQRLSFPSPMTGRASPRDRRTGMIHDPVQVEQAIINLFVKERTLRSPYQYDFNGQNQFMRRKIAIFMRVCRLCEQYDVTQIPEEGIIKLACTEEICCNIYPCSRPREWLILSLGYPCGQSRSCCRGCRSGKCICDTKTEGTICWSHDAEGRCWTLNGVRVGSKASQDDEKLDSGSDLDPARVSYALTMSPQAKLLL